MKKQIFVILIVMILIIATMPMGSALAKRDVVFVNIQVRNLTGAPVSLIITDSLGLYSHLYIYEPGIWNLNIEQGEYAYKASTSCGMTSGFANFDRTKKLAFHCNPGAESSVYRAGPACGLRTGGFNAKPSCAY
ncbi:MAG: hypothetical protein WCP19_14200 [Chloroflexota bacterium]